MIETDKQYKTDPSRETVDCDDYRSRIYSSYITAHSELAWHETVADLGRRGHELKNLIRKHFLPDKETSIIDLGCGHGAIMHFAREMGYKNINGVDRSQEQTDLATRLGIDSVVKADLMDWLEKSSEQTYDMVISFDIVEHFTKTEFVNFANQVNSILKPGGRWLIHTCNGDSPFFGSSSYGDFTHEITFSSRSIKQVLNAYGFSNIDTYEDAPVAHGIVSFVRLLLWRFVDIVYRLLWAIETGSLNPDAVFTKNFLIVAVK